MAKNIRRSSTSTFHKLKDMATRVTCDETHGAVNRGFEMAQSAVTNQISRGRSTKSGRNVLFRVTSRNDNDFVSTLGHAIHTGDAKLIQEIVRNNGSQAVINARFVFQISVRRLGYMDAREQYQPIMSQLAKMTVTSLQLAVISEEISAVELLLSLVPTSSEKAENDLKLSMIGGPKARVDFEESIKMYGEGDRMLHGCSAFDLAARFHADSLGLFIDLFKNRASTLQELIDEKRSEGHPMEFSALHLAACNPSTDGIRLLIDHMENIDILNDRGFTPLHIASRASLQDNVLLLLEYGADPNIRGHNGSTPLHRAVKASIVQILIQHGADDCVTTNKKKTALDVLMDKNPSAVKAILDDKIYTNGQDLTSQHLLLVFDLEVIKKSEQSAELHEMTLLTKLAKANQQSLLEHPLSEAFLVLKGQLLRRYNVSNIILYFCYAVSLSALGRTSTKVRVECRALHPEKETDINDCVTPNESHLYWRFWVFYFITCALIAFVFFREVTQAYSNLRRYFTDLENWMEIAMLTMAIAYVVTLVFSLDISPHFGAISILIAWLDFFFMLGRFPSVGHYIFMCWTVSKMIVRFVAIFIFIILGFAISFHMLLPSTNSFDQLWISGLKCLVMMSGEFEFEDVFTSDAVTHAGLDDSNVSVISDCIFNCSQNNDSPIDLNIILNIANCTVKCMKIHEPSPSSNLNVNLTPQLIFILFFFLVSIVISNLLIGLTVNRTDEVEKASVGLRLERTLQQVVSIEDFLLDKIARSKFLPGSFKDWLINMTQLFSYLDLAYNRSELFLRKKSSSGYKICIRPYETVKETWNEYKQFDFFGLSALLNLDGHFVYLYNEKYGSVGTRLKRLALPESIVTRSLKLVQDRRQDILEGGLASLTDPTRVKRRWTGGHVMGPLVINSRIGAPDEKFERGTIVESPTKRDSPETSQMNSFGSANTTHVTLDSDDNSDSHL